MDATDAPGNWNPKSSPKLRPLRPQLVLQAREIGGIPPQGQNFDPGILRHLNWSGSSRLSTACCMKGEMFCKTEEKFTGPLGFNIVHR